MINKKNRLNKDKEIEAVFKNKETCYNKYVGVLIKENKLDFNRFVIIISNKNIKKAVERNKAKRQIKSIIDKQQKKFSFFVDLVIIVKKEIYFASFSEIEQDIFVCLKKLKLIK
jgi:ribonuclease P protein component